MLYLLDANTLIDAKRDYYPFERVPEFWTWLKHQGDLGRVKIPLEIYEEFGETRRSDGTRDDLAEWASRPEIKTALLFGEEADPILVAQSTEDGYAADLTDEEVEKIGRDPFLLSYALRDPSNRTIVTTEVSKPGKQKANRRLPDVCRDLGLRCINNFQFLVECDFKTQWRDEKS